MIEIIRIGCDTGHGNKKKKELIKIRQNGAHEEITKSLVWNRGITKFNNN